LDIVLKVGKNLEKIPGDLKVIYTRKTDVFIELRERAKIANKADADLFVSVHCNAHDSQAHTVLKPMSLAFTEMTRTSKSHKKKMK